MWTNQVDGPVRIGQIWLCCPPLSHLARRSENVSTSKKIAWPIVVPIFKEKLYCSSRLWWKEAQRRQSWFRKWVRSDSLHISPKASYAFRTKPRVRQIYIDDIDSFGRVRRFSKANSAIVRGMPERKINRALCRILNQSEKKDWGGERNDIYTNKMIVAGSRKSAAFALKGKAIKTKLVPGKMGKNGDQIPRLFEATADIYVVGRSTIVLLILCRLMRSETR